MIENDDFKLARLQSLQAEEEVGLYWCAITCVSTVDCNSTCGGTF